MADDLIGVGHLLQGATPSPRLTIIDPAHREPSLNAAFALLRSPCDNAAPDLRSVGLRHWAGYRRDEGDDDPD